MTARPGRPHAACLGLGSNHEPGRHLASAVSALGREPVLEVGAVSAAWESPAFGSPGPDYVNAALLVRTRLGRGSLKSLLRRVETDLGRSRAGASPLVPIDIDLLTFDSEVLEPGLFDLPHLCVPASELLPGLVNALSGETLASAARRLAARAPIRPRPDALRASGTRPSS